MSRKISRRQFATATALSTVAFIGAPHVRGAHAAGKLSIGLWDHFVPAANKASGDLIREWAAKEKVDIQIDYIASQGNKLLLTTTAEAQAKVGHDILAMSTWRPLIHAEQLEPVDDIMEWIIKQNGEVNSAVEYLGQVQGRWMAVPATVWSQIQAPCSRIDLMKKYAGIDVQDMYPAGAPPRADGWTSETFLKAAEACHKGGFSLRYRIGRDSR